MLMQVNFNSTSFFQFAPSQKTLPLNCRILAIFFHENLATNFLFLYSSSCIRVVSCKRILPVSFISFSKPEIDATSIVFYSIYHLFYYEKKEAFKKIEVLEDCSWQ